MKAVVFHEFGGLDVLRLEEVPDPEPGPGEVAARHPRRGAQPSRRRHPRGRLALPGRAAVHARRRGRRRGSRRSARASTGWAGRRPRAAVPDRHLRRMPSTAGPAARRSACRRASSASRHRAATRRSSPARRGHLIRMPDGSRDEAAAATQIAFGTAWHMLFTRGRPARRRDGADQLGRQRHRLGRRAARQARRRVRDRQRELRREARAGERARAWTTASTTPPQDVVAEVMRLTDGRGVDLVFEHVGGELFQKGLDSLGEGRPPRHLRRALRRGRPLRHHPLLPQAEADHRLVHLQPRGGREGASTSPRAG